MNKPLERFMNLCFRVDKHVSAASLAIAKQDVYIANDELKAEQLSILTGEAAEKAIDAYCDYLRLPYQSLEWQGLCGYRIRIRICMHAYVCMHMYACLCMHAYV